MTWNIYYNANRFADHNRPLLHSSAPSLAEAIYQAKSILDCESGTAEAILRTDQPEDPQGLLIWFDEGEFRIESL
jgi:hypothetical protein